MSAEPTSVRQRLFVAAFPPVDVLDTLDDIPRTGGAGVRWVPRERRHVTLRFLGATDPAGVADRLATADLPAARATLGPAIARLGPDAIVVPMAGLDRLAATIVEASADLGRPPEPRPFTGHLTVARARRGASCGALGHPVRGAFDVDEVCLVDSRTEAGHLRYEVVARFPTR